jgi:hypothetical protein
LLLGVEGFELGSGFVGETVPGRTPQLLVLQELEILEGLCQIVRQLLFVRSDGGDHVQNLSLQGAACTLSPALEVLEQ